VPRSPRLELAGVPMHVIQRGNNRAACFFGVVDRRFYLKCLRKSAARTGCLIHAYVLMTNHVHLLVTPGAPGAVGAMLQDIGRRYVRVINTIHGRTGTLWEGRFKSSLVDSERYLLTCHRYIELNPVRAGLVTGPSAYPWSSHPHYAAGRLNDLITEHAAFHGLGATAAERQAAFRELFLNDLDPRTLARIREAVNAGCPLGSPPPRRGRPAKAAANADSEAVISGKLF
jgi:putative transposase